MAALNLSTLRHQLLPGSRLSLQLPLPSTSKLSQLQHPDRNRFDSFTQSRLSVPDFFADPPPCPSSHTTTPLSRLQVRIQIPPKPSSHILLFCSGDVSRRLHIFLLFWPVHLTQTMEERRIYLGSWFPRCWSIVMEDVVK